VKPLSLIVYYEVIKLDEDMTRKWRLDKLLYRQKMKQVVAYGDLFDECVEALGDGTVLLSIDKSEEIYDCLQKSYPFTPRSRIDWMEIKSKIAINNYNEIIPRLINKENEIVEYVFILWSHGNFPVLQTQLQLAIVIAVSSDTFIYAPSKFVIEFHHEGEVTIGFEK
jgi:uncharacterized phage-associated protein